MASPVASSGILTASDEMLSSENGGAVEDIGASDAMLLDRIDDLERRVQSQEDELMCLRSSTAEALRRLNGLEQSLFSGKNSSITTNSTIAKTPYISAMKATPSRPQSSSNTSDATLTPISGDKRSQNHAISRSAYNLHTPLPSKSRPTVDRHTLLGSGKNCNGTRTDENAPRGEAFDQTYPRPRRYIRRSADKVNIRNTPMKKWMSSADVKYNGRRGSTDHLVVNNNSKDAGDRASITNLPCYKSVSKLGSIKSISTSQRSLSHFELEIIREPLFLPEKGVLQLFVNGKTMQLPAPNSVTDLDPLRELDAPNCKPSLDWVYGYRGKDCRENLHELPTGEIVYFTGTIAVLHNPAERLQRFYTEHTSDIRCMAVHPNKLHIATGQTSRRFLEKNGLNIHRSPISSITELNNVLETDQYQAHVRIWDSVTLQTLRTIGTGYSNADFDRGVQCCSFSRSAGGTLLALITDSFEHTLSVWKWQVGVKIAEMKSANDQVFACEFHPSKNILISYGKGHFNIWKINGETLVKKPLAFEGRNKPKLVLCAHFTERGHIVTGDSNGTLTLWDSKQLKVVRQEVKAHDGGVWAICLLGSGHIISAGKDRKLLEWEANGLSRVRGPVTFPDEGSGCIRTVTPTSSGSTLFIGTTRNSIWSGTLETGFHPIQQGHAGGVRQICAHPTKPQFMLLSSDSILRWYDLETKAIFWSLDVEDRIYCADFHSHEDVFAIGFTNGLWSIYDFTNRVQLYAFNEGVDNVITTIRFSTAGNFLAVATKDKKLLIYAISGDFRHYVKAAEITDLNAPITTIDWSTDGTLLRANDDDLQHYVWNSSTGRPVTVKEVGAVQWASSRCRMSFENACIYISCASKGMVVADAERSPDNSFVVVGLSNGLLRFYQYPTTTVMASYKGVSGYSICTKNVAFVGEVLLNDGASDGTIYQWKL